MGHRINAKGVAARSVEGKEHTSLLAKLLLELLFSCSAIFVIAVCHSMFCVHAGNGFQNLGTHARMVVASKSSFHHTIFFASSKIMLAKRSASASVLPSE